MFGALGIARSDSGLPSDGRSGRIAVAPGMTASERDEVIHRWNATSVPYPDVCVQSLFEQQVERTPDAVAVVFGDRRLTYRALNERANQVGHFLRRRGVGPESLVGVCLERTPDLVVALLGVWKAGGAYVPLDPAYPEKRLSFMVEDAAIGVLLTDQRCKRLFSSFEGQAVCVDADWSVIAKEASTNPEPIAIPENLAYVMYTSGSTGQPKGAMILHRGLVNYLTWAVGAYAVKAGGSVPVHTSASFDLTVTSLYPALLTGAEVELLPEDVAAQNLLSALRRRKGRTLVKITPAHLDLLARQLSPQEVSGMTQLFVVGGENLAAETLRLWRESSPQTRIVNEYGPTETVVGCCVYEVRADDPSNGSVPIGRPIANTQMYVLDAELQPVPPGVMGELYIGGAGVARGYLNRPELTRERFVADPFSGRPDARLYKTGDLGRYRADGVLEYLGRVDDQVKVRGYRIELGEIEAALAGHPAVQSCAVVVREDSPGDKQLVGYVVARPGQSPEIADMREFIRRRLPDYMTPGQVVVLQSLPLTTNGKVDRKALPDPATVAMIATTVHPARTPTERALAEIWQHILERESVSIRDDFFDIGGHSVQVLAMLSEIKRTLGADLDLSSILPHATIERIAQTIDSHRPAVVVAETQTSPWLTELRAGSGSQCFFFVYDGDGEILPYVNIAREMPTEISVYGILPFRLPGIPLGHLTIEEMARHCVESIQRRQPHGPYSLGGLCAGGEIAFETARQLEEQGESVEVVLLLDAVRPATPQRPWLHSKRRWRRFSAVFEAQADGGGLPPEASRDWGQPMLQAFHKVHSVARFEAVRSVKSAWLAARRRLLTRVLAHGMAWPSWIPSLSVRDIYNFRARQTYRPGPVFGRVVLVKAAEGEERGADLVDDPYLGWKPYAVGRLDVIDAPGGHVEMLKEPNLRVVVDELLRVLRGGDARAPNMLNTP